MDGPVLPVTVSPRLRPLHRGHSAGSSPGPALLTGAGPSNSWKEAQNPLLREGCTGRRNGAKLGSLLIFSSPTPSATKGHLPWAVLISPLPVLETSPVQVTPGESKLSVPRPIRSPLPEGLQANERSGWQFCGLGFVK